MLAIRDWMGAFKRREHWYVVLGLAGLATLIAVAVITTLSNFSYNEAARRQRHSSDVLTTIREVEFAVLEADSERKAYKLETTPETLERFHQSLAKIDVFMAVLASEQAHSKKQQGQVQALRSVLDRLRTEWALGRSHLGLKAEVWDLLNEIRDVEFVVLRRLSASRDAEYSFTMVVILFSSGISFCLLFAAMLFMFVELRRRRLSELRQRHARRRAMEASQAKSQFLARMSHEIRTPMNGILGMAELLQRTPMSEVQLKNIGIIHQSATSLLSVINDILDLSKVEAGKMELDCADFSVTRLLDEVLQSMDYAARAKHLTLEMKNDMPISKTFRGDAFRVRQILVNLIGNAIKFSDKGNIRVNLRRDERGLLCFEVVDQGPGMAEETAKRLFSPFYQGRMAAAQKQGGTGLGLAISRELVELMGGEIGVISSPGRGSTFWFHLPLAEGRELELGLEKTAVHFVGPAKAHILVAEDNEINQLVMQGMLEKLGHTYEVVGNGQLVIERLASGRHYDLVLMDCHMPVLDGYEAVAQIRRMDGPCKTVPVVAVSASAIKGEKERCLQAGMDDYLSKPLLLNDLSAKINQWFSRPGYADQAA